MERSKEDFKLAYDIVMEFVKSFKEEKGTPPTAGDILMHLNFSKQEDDQKYRKVQHSEIIQK